MTCCLVGLAALGPPYGTSGLCFLDADRHVIEFRITDVFVDAGELIDGATAERLIVEPPQLCRAGSCRPPFLSKCSKCTAPEFTSGVPRLLHYFGWGKPCVVQRRENPRDEPGGE